MMYTLDGKQLTDKEAEAQKKINDMLLNEAYDTGDMSKLNNIVWLVSVEVMEFTGKEWFPPEY